MPDCCDICAYALTAEELAFPVGVPCEHPFHDYPMVAVALSADGQRGYWRGASGTLYRDKLVGAEWSHELIGADMSERQERLA